MATKKGQDKLKMSEIDENIADLFDIKKRLGKGAYGIVWKAIEKRTNETLAVKKIFDAFRDETDAQRTFREIIFLKAFRNHPNVVRLHNVYTARNNLDIYLIFEFMESDLHNIIKKGTILKDIHKRYVMYQLVNAIKYIHSGNVIHRDLKPSNVLIDSKCRCKLADFGLARSVSNRQANDQSNTNGDHAVQPLLTDYVATRWYRAPEILVASKRYTKGIDMWSLGCILGEMIRGKPLFQGSSTINQIEKIVNALPEITDQDIKAVGAGFGSVLLSKQINRECTTSLEDLLMDGPSDARKLVKALLVLDPRARLTASDTLDHIYVEKFRNSIPELELTVDILPPFRDDVRLSVPEYRSKLYEIVQVPNDKIHHHIQQRQSNANLMSAKSRDQRTLHGADVSIAKRHSKSTKSHSVSEDKLVSKDKERSRHERQEFEMQQSISVASIIPKLSKSRAEPSPPSPKFRSLPKTKKHLSIEENTIQNLDGQYVVSKNKMNTKSREPVENPMRALRNEKRNSIDLTSNQDGGRPATPKSVAKCLDVSHRQHRSSSLANQRVEYTTVQHTHAQIPQHHHKNHGSVRPSAPPPPPAMERDYREAHRSNPNPRPHLQRTSQTPVVHVNNMPYVRYSKADMIATMVAMESPNLPPTVDPITPAIINKSQDQVCYEKRLKKLEEEIEKYKKEVKTYCKGSVNCSQPQPQPQLQRNQPMQHHSLPDNTPIKKHNSDSSSAMPVIKSTNVVGGPHKKNPYFQIMSKANQNLSKPEYEFTYTGTGGSGDHIAQPHQHDFEKCSERQPHHEKQNREPNHHYQQRNNCERQSRDYQSHHQQPHGAKSRPQSQPRHQQHQHCQHQQPQMQRIKPVSKFHLQSHTSTRTNF